MKNHTGKPGTPYTIWSGYWKDKNDSRFIPFAVRILSILLVYMLTDRGLMFLTRLPTESYFEKFIVLEFLTKLFSGPLIILVGAGLTAAFFLRKQLLCKWNSLENGAQLRLLVLACVFLLTWRFSAYDFNLFLNQPHYLDRFLLIFFAVLVYIRPIFVVPFLLVLLPVIGQFNTFMGFTWTSAYLPIRVLMLFAVFLLFKLVFNLFSAKDFVFLTACIFAAHYFAPGSGKLDLSWILNNQLYLFLPAAYTNGWLGFLKPSTIESITNFISPFNWPMKLFTLFAELGAVFFLFNRFTSRIFPVVWVFLHLGIFLTSGIFFWMWILLDLTILLLFLRSESFYKLFPLPYSKIAMSIILIAGGALWCRPVVLAWYEVPVSYGYRFIAEGESGNKYQLDPAFFSPYDSNFAVGAGFGFLTKIPVLANTGGGTFSKRTFETLSSTRSLDNFDSIEKELGQVIDNPKSTKSLDAFLVRYLQNWNNRKSKNVLVNFARPPLLIWTFPTGESPSADDKLISVDVIQTAAVFSNGRYRTVRNSKIHEVVIEE